MRLFFFCFLINFGLSQPKLSSFFQNSKNNYIGEIGSIFQDSDDIIWFTHGSRISRLTNNGYTDFEHINKDLTVSGTLHSILEDKKKRLWFGSHSSGIYILNKQNRSLTHIHDNSFNKLSGNKTRDLLLVNDSTIWVATNGAINQVNTNTLEISKLKFSELENEIYMSVEKKNDSIIWVGTFYSGLFEYNIHTGRKLILELPTNSSKSIMDLAYDKSGSSLYVGMVNGLIHQLNIKKKKISTYVLDRKKGSPIRKIFIDSNIIIVGIDNLKLLYINKKTNKINPFNKINELLPYNTDRILSIGSDRKRNLYLGSLKGLLLTIQKKASLKYDLFLKKHNIRMIKLVKDTIWIGSENQGLYYYNNGKVQKKILSSWPRITPMDMVIDSKDRKYIGTSRNGLLVIEEKGIKHFNVNKTKEINTIFSLELYNSLLLIGTSNGLYQYKYPNYFKKIDFFYPKKIIDIRRIIVNNDNIYLSSGKGVYKINIVEYSYQKLSNKYTYDIKKNKYSFSGSDQNYFEFVQDSIIQTYKLPISPRASIEGKYNNQWVIGGATVLNLSKEHEDTYTIYKDLIQNVSFNNSIEKTESSIYFASSTGLIRVEDQAISSHSSKTYITDIKILGESLNLPLPIKDKTKINLDYNENNIEILFMNTSYSLYKSVQFKYKFHNLDNNWTKLESKRLAFNRLNDGKYVLNLKSTNSEGFWNSDHTRLIININPPFYRSNIAFLLYIVIVLSFFFLYLSRYRAKTKAREYLLLNSLEKEKLRNQIASDLHDEIGGNLTNISFVSQLLQQENRDKLNDKKELKNISSIAQQTSEAIREIVWFVNPENESIEKTLEKIKQTSQMMLGNINYELEISPEIMGIQLDINSNRNIYLVHKEALQNIIKHSNAKAVKVIFKKSHDNLIFKISDNGVGFDLKEKSKGNGLKKSKKKSRFIECKY